METNQILNRLNSFKFKVVNISEKKLTDFISKELFSFIIKTPSLKRMLDSRLYYDNELGTKPRVKKNQSILIEIIDQILCLFSAEDLRSIQQKFDCSCFRRHQKADSVSAIEASEIMKNSENYWLIGEESQQHVRLQYSAFEKLLNHLSPIARANPSILNDYSSLSLSYKITMNDYIQEVDVYFEINHIQNFINLMNWVIDKNIYPEYLLLGTFSKGKKIVNVHPKELRELTLEVIDDFIIDLNTRTANPSVSGDSLLNNVNHSTSTKFPYLGIILDTKKLTITFDNHIIRVNPASQEMRFLKLLLSNQDQVSEYPDILKVMGITPAVLQTERDYRDRMKEARQALVEVLADGSPERKAKARKMIKNVRDLGYQIVEAPL